MVPQRVLIAEDHRDLAETLREAFDKAGYAATACRTFEQAHGMLLREAFDVLVTDVRLGDFNGLQLAVIARDKTPRIRIVVISGFDDPVLREEAANVGATYLMKPTTHERLLAAVQSSPLPDSHDR